MQGPIEHGAKVTLNVMARAYRQISEGTRGEQAGLLRRQITNGLTALVWQKTNALVITGIVSHSRNASKTLSRRILNQILYIHCRSLNSLRSREVPLLEQAKS